MLSVVAPTLQLHPNFQNKQTLFLIFKEIDPKQLQGDSTIKLFRGKATALITASMDKL